MTIKQDGKVTRCCRCGSGEAAIWFPLYRFRLLICGGCYSHAIMAGAALDMTRPQVPV